MKRLWLSMFFALLFVLGVSMTAVEEECADIRTQVLRLHVLANSDSQQDQQLKLRVRDRLLEYSEEIFMNATDRQSAIEAATAHIDELERIALETVRAEGFGYGVEVSIGECFFDTRTYGEVTLPAGTYQALRVELGEAQGHNWWCVMFPPMCLPAAQGEAELAAVLTDEQMEMCTGGYEIKFKCVEVWEEFIAALRNE